MKNCGNLSDIELAHLLQDGDYNAFTEIYNRNWKNLLRYVSRIAGDDQDEAEDILQEVFISLWKRHAVLQTENLQSWLYGAARRNALFHLRTAKTRNKYIASLSDYLTEVSTNLDDEIEVKELSALIDREIDRLPHKMKEIFILSRKENLSHKEIADRLGISDKTVKKQINNVLKIFRNRLDNGSAGLIALIVINLFKE